MKNENPRVLKNELLQKRDQAKDMEKVMADLTQAFTDLHGEIANALERGSVPPQKVLAIKKDVKTYADTGAFLFKAKRMSIPESLKELQRLALEPLPQDVDFWMEKMAHMTLEVRDALEKVQLRYSLLAEEYQQAEEGMIFQNKKSGSA